MERPTVVIKVGTSSLVDTKTGIVQLSAVSRVAETCSRLIAASYHVIIVTSGAVGLGCARLGMKERPTHIAGKQAAAAAGQLRLMSLYDNLFSVLGYTVAQVLLTYDTFGDRTQYLNARNTFLELLRLNAIPIVNENDTVAIQEIRVGDNDTLSALVASMVNAQYLFLLTDVDSLYTSNPKDYSTSLPIRVIRTPAEISNLRKQMLAGCRLLAPTLSVEEAELEASKLGFELFKESSATVSLSPSGNTTSFTSPSSSSPTPRSRSESPNNTVTMGKLKVVSSPVVTLDSSVSSPASATVASKTGLSKGNSKNDLSISTTANTNPSNTGRAGSQWGTGGMITKLKAAQLGTAAGVTVVIMNTQKVECIDMLLLSGTTSGKPTNTTGTSSLAEDTLTAASSNTGGSRTISSSLSPALTTSVSKSLVFVEQQVGTTFIPSVRPVTGRKRWILSLNAEGSIMLDDGAVTAVVDSRKSLFPAGVVEVEGNFEAQDAIAILSPDRVEIARALVNYSSEDCRKLRGRKSKDITDILGYLGAEALCDRDNIVILHTRGTVEN